MRYGALNYSFADYGAMIIIISFLGFCLENIWMLFRKGYIDNRNMNLPFLLGYGLLVTGLFIVIGIPPRGGLVRYFLLCFVIVSVGEIILGTAVEKLCGIHYWDYSSLPLHITRYTSVFTSIGFALIITCFMNYCFTPLMGFIDRYMSMPVMIITAAILILMAADFLYSFRYMILNSSYYEVWKLELFKGLEAGLR